MEWLNSFFIPLIKIVFVGGFFGWLAFIIGKALWNAWSRQTKFFVRYKIRKKPYPENIVEWCADCIDEGIGYYDAKKLLVVKMMPTDIVNETMWIYDQILTQLQGGQKEYGRELTRGYSEDKSKTKFPNVKGRG